MKQNKPRSGAEKLKESLVNDVQNFVHNQGPGNDHNQEQDLSEKTIFVDFEQHKVIPPPAPEEVKKLAQTKVDPNSNPIRQQDHQKTGGHQHSISSDGKNADKGQIQFYDIEDPVEGFDLQVPEYQDPVLTNNAQMSSLGVSQNQNSSMNEAGYDPLSFPQAALQNDEPDYMADLFPDDKTQVVGREEVEKTVVLKGHSPQQAPQDRKNKIDIFEPPANHQIKKQVPQNQYSGVLAGADALQLAQEKIKNLEAEVDRLRADNDELSNSAELIKQKVIEYRSELQKVEHDKANLEEILNSEIHILKSNLQFRDQEKSKFQQEIETLQARLKSDFKKIRVRERELENRLELLRVEKATLLKTKDEQILDLKRKIDQLQMENDNYRQKCVELNRTIEGNQDQFKRTVRALRLALTNLESKDPGSIKKAE